MHHQHNAVEETKHDEEQIVFRALFALIERREYIDKESGNIKLFGQIVRASEYKFEVSYLVKTKFQEQVIVLLEMFANGFPCGYQMTGGYHNYTKEKDQFEGRYEKMLRERYKHPENQMAVKLLSRVFSLLPLPELAGNEKKVSNCLPDQYRAVT